MTTSMNRSNRTARRAESTRTRTSWISSVLPLALVLWGCEGRDSVEHRPDAFELEDGEAAATIEYTFDPSTVRAVHGYVVAVQPFQRMQGTRYGVRVRLDVDHERVYVYLAPQGFLADHGLDLSVGDEIDATGSLLGEPGRRVLIATEIVRYGKTYELRDGEGHPRWR
jgi:hypothetical protein